MDTGESDDLTPRSADVSVVRSHNLGLILDHVRRAGPTARADLAESTGLVRGSITAMVQQLISLGLVKESRQNLARRAGRPLPPIELDGSAFAIVAVHIGIEEVVVSAIDLGERKLLSRRASHGRPLGDPHAVADVAAAVVDGVLRELADQSVVARQVIVAVQAPLIGSPPVVLTSFDLGWDMVDFVALLRSRLPELQVQVTLVNDSNMAAFAEFRARRAATGQVTDVVYLESRTGIGGGMITEGRVLRGSHGIGFEPGHVIVNTDGAACNCGRRGCLVAEIGPGEILRRAGLSDIARRIGLEQAIGVLVQAARSGDPAALAALAYAGTVLAQFVTDLGVLVDPAHVLLGGYWADVFPFLRMAEALRAAVPAELGRSWAAGGRSLDDFVIPGVLGEDASLIGAQAFALDQLFRDPLSIA